MTQATAHGSSSKRKRNLYEEFNQMIKYKYEIVDDMFAKMSYKERN